MLERLEHVQAVDTMTERIEKREQEKDELQVQLAVEIRRLLSPNPKLKSSYMPSNWKM